MISCQSSGSDNPSLEMHGLLIKADVKLFHSLVVSGIDVTTKRDILQGITQ